MRWLRSTAFGDAAAADATGARRCREPSARWSTPLSGTGQSDHGDGDHTGGTGSIFLATACSSRIGPGVAPRRVERRGSASGSAPSGSGGATSVRHTHRYPDHRAQRRARVEVEQPPAQCDVFRPLWTSFSLSERAAVRTVSDRLERLPIDRSAAGTWCVLKKRSTSFLAAGVAGGTAARFDEPDMPCKIPSFGCERVPPLSSRTPGLGPRASRLGQETIPMIGRRRPGCAAQAIA